MNNRTHRIVSLAALFVLGSFATGCAFDPNASGADADESESTGTVQQAAIVWRAPGTGVAPTCGSLENSDGLCYPKCQPGYTGQGTRCIESCGITNGTCWRDESCSFGWGTPYACRRQYPAQFTDRGAGVPPSCALMGRAAGKDGLCYPLTGSSGNATPAPAKTPAPAQTAPAVKGESAAAKECVHSTDRNGHLMVWVEDGFGGRCISRSEQKPLFEQPSSGGTEGLDICPFAGGCGGHQVGNMYDGTGSVTNFHPTTGQDLLGYSDNP